MSRDRIQELQQPRNYSSSNNSRDSTNRPIEMSARSNAPANDFAGEVRLLTQLDKATRYTSSIDRKIDQIASLHERALVAVGQDEINRTTAQVDALQAETNQMMDKVRRCLSNLSNETNRMRGNQVNARKAQQATVARKLMDVARKYEKVQQKYKLKYQQRITREIRIARPDASVEEVNYALQSGNTAVFAQEMIQGRSGDQRRVLEQVQTRHDELMKIEQSVEQLATLFQDMQVLLEQQQEVIDVVVTQVEDSRGYLEQGGKEITQAIDYRVSSRKKLWWIFGIIVVLLVVLALVVYLKRCEWLGVQCTPPAAPGK